MNTYRVSFNGSRSIMASGVNALDAVRVASIGTIDGSALTFDPIAPKNRTIWTIKDAGKMIATATVHKAKNQSEGFCLLCGCKAQTSDRFCGNCGTKFA